MNMHPVAAELVHADERTDITKLTVDFRDFANVPKKVATTRELSTFLLQIRQLNLQATENSRMKWTEDRKRLCRFCLQILRVLAGGVVLSS